MKRISRTEFSLEIHPMGAIGFILIVTSLVMFGNLAEHGWADNKRLTLAFVFLGIGIAICGIEAIWDRINDRGPRT